MQKSSYSLVRRIKRRVLDCILEATLNAFVALLYKACVFDANLYSDLWNMQWTLTTCSCTEMGGFLLSVLLCTDMTTWHRWSLSIVTSQGCRDIFIRVFSLIFQWFSSFSDRGFGSVQCFSIVIFFSISIFLGVTRVILIVICAMWRAEVVQADLLERSIVLNCSWVNA